MFWSTNSDKTPLTTYYKNQNKIILFFFGQQFLTIFVLFAPPLLRMHFITRNSTRVCYDISRISVQSISRSNHNKRRRIIPFSKFHKQRRQLQQCLRRVTIIIMLAMEMQRCQQAATTITTPTMASLRIRPKCCTAWSRVLLVPG